MVNFVLIKISANSSVILSAIEEIKAILALVFFLALIMAFYPTLKLLGSHLSLLGTSKTNKTKSFVFSQIVINNSFIFLITPDDKVW